jgi:ribosomal protein L16 Arg81 hydroxylase
MTNGILQYLLAPTEVETFARDLWEQKPLHVAREDPSYYAQILTLETLDEYLSRNDIRYPSLRMIQGGKAIPVESFSRPLKFGSYTASGLIDMDRVYDLYQNGASLVLQLMRSSIDSLSRFANQLQREVHFNVEATIYVTPANEQGFTTHYDTHSVLVLQVAGQKRWRLYDFPKRYPLLTDTFDTVEYVPTACSHDITLGPGDLLYVPRGMAHDATANKGSKSVHITIGLFPPMWRDIFDTRLAQLSEDVKFRRAPAQFFLAGQESVFSAELLQMCTDAFHEIGPLQLLKETLRQHLPRQSRRVNGLLNRGGRLLGANTVVRARSDIAWQVDANVRNIEIYFYEKRLRLPLDVRPAIDRLLSGEPVSVATLQNGLDLESSILVCKTLLDAGIVDVVE